MNLLYVCTYNTERSIAADIITSKKAALAGLDLYVDSAGINRSMSPRIKSEMAMALERLGYKVPEHTPRRVTPNDLSDFDLVLCFDQAQKQTLEQMAGKPIQTLPEFVSMPRDIREPAHYLRTPATLPPSRLFSIICLITNTSDSTVYENVLFTYEKTARIIEKHVDLLLKKLTCNSLPCSTQRAG
ncbi:Low molecular weight phosphotyrosine protein phosphatase [uncultured archaeon]|nr:Low molecular weight phosphotyrosine protein phosphatase [uncultured archaeon]